MRVSEAFPSNYVKAADLRGNNARVVIDRVKIEEIGDDRKPVLYFQGKEKGLVLNKTNANNISVLYGDDMEEWQGKEIILFPAMVDFQGRTVEAIRVRGVPHKERATASPYHGQAPLPRENITSGPQPSRVTGNLVNGDMPDDDLPPGF